MKHKENACSKSGTRVSVCKKTCFLTDWQRKKKPPRQATRPRSVCGYSRGERCEVSQNALRSKDFLQSLSLFAAQKHSSLYKGAWFIPHRKMIAFWRLAGSLTLWAVRWSAPLPREAKQNVAIYSISVRQEGKTMKNNLLKQFFSALLVLVMVLSLLPATAMAQ